MKSGFVNDITPALVDELVRRAEASPRREIAVVLTQLGGAIQDLPADATAYAHRYAEFDLMVGAAWDDGFNSLRLGGYEVLDLRASLPLGGGLRAFGRVENLLDADYRTAAGYAQAGRGAFAGVRFDF